MALNTELLMTLQQLKGFGNKTILKVAESCSADTVEELVSFWSVLREKGERFRKVSDEDIFWAYRTANRIKDVCEQEGIGIISYFEDRFPEILRHCTNEKGQLDQPIVLYYRGNLDVLHKPGVAVIGTREPTENGIKAGLYFSGEIASRGFNIVSGLAIGCDTTGHKGALACGGSTTAFLANGLMWDEIYPQENQQLAKDIVDNRGLLLSEYYPGQRTGRYAFVARDRLQAGLSVATVVIQTGIAGGTMHAVNATINAKKQLYAVAYNNIADQRNPKALGNLKLIQDGKAAVLCTKNLEEAVTRIKAAKVPKARNPSLFD